MQKRPISYAKETYIICKREAYHTYKRQRRNKEPADVKETYIIRKRDLYHI